MEWVKSKYKEEEFAEKFIIDTIQPINCGRMGYNVYQTRTGMYINVFDDQIALKNLIKHNTESILALRFLDPDNSKHSYTILYNGEEIRLHTIAAAGVLVEGTEDNPQKLYVDHEEYIIVG